MLDMPTLPTHRLAACAPALAKWDKWKYQTCPHGSYLRIKSTTSRQVCDCSSAEKKGFKDLQRDFMEQMPGTSIASTSYHCLRSISIGLQASQICLCLQRSLRYNLTAGRGTHETRFLTESRLAAALQRGDDSKHLEISWVLEHTTCNTNSH